MNTGSDQEKFHLPCSELWESKRADFNCLPSSASTSAFQFSIQISLRLFREPKPTLHSWGEQVPQHLSITLMKCAFHLRLWGENIKTLNHYIETSSHYDNFETAPGRSKTISAFLAFLIYLWKFEVYMDRSIYNKQIKKKSNWCSATADRDPYQIKPSGEKVSWETINET